MTNMWNQVSLFLQFSGEESNLSLFASSIRKDFYKTRGKNNKDNNKDTNKSELMSLTNRNINNHSVANNPGDLTSRIVVNNNFDPYFKVDNNSNINWPGTPLSNNNHAKTNNINNNSNQLSKFSTLKKSNILNPSVKFDNKTTDISKVATKNKNKSLNLNSSQQNVVSNMSDDNNNNSMVFNNPNLDKKLIYIIVNNNNSTGNEIKIDSNLINNSLSNIQNNNNKSFSYNAYKTFSNNKPFKNIQFDRTNINNCDSSKQNLNTNNQIQNMINNKNNLDFENHSMKNTQNLLSDNYYCTHQTKASLSILENIYTKAMKSFELSMVNSKTAKEKKDSVKLLIKTLKPVMLNLKFLRDKLEFNNDCLKETNKILSLEINEIEVDKSKEKFCLHCHKTFKLKSKIENKEEVRNYHI